MRVAVATLAAVQAAARRTKEARWFRYAWAQVPGPFGSTSAFTQADALTGNFKPLKAEEVPSDIDVSNRRVYAFVWVGDVRLGAGDAVGDANGPVYEVLGLMDSPSGGQAVHRAVVARRDKAVG